MEFFIKKNATLPVLKINVIKDGRSDYDRTMRYLQETDIFFKPQEGERKADAIGADAVLNDGADPPFGVDGITHQSEDGHKAQSNDLDQGGDEGEREPVHGNDVFEAQRLGAGGRE